MNNFTATLGLRRVLMGNALFSTGCALVSLLFAESVAIAMGLSYPQDLRVLGGALIVFAAGVAFLARRPVSPLPAWSVWSVIIADAIWVLGSVSALVSESAPFTSLGQFVIATVAAIVGTFAVLQVRFQAQSRS
ncbi:MAG: hypothetical protein SynsKO_09190 [Synoicihabitans sp.]